MCLAAGGCCGPGRVRVMSLVACDRLRLVQVWQQWSVGGRCSVGGSQSSVFVDVASLALAVEGPRSLFHSRCVRGGPGIRGRVERLLGRDTHMREQ